MANEHDTISRRDFTSRSLLALFAGVAVTISGCGDDDPSDPTPVDETGNISNNHGHVATITAAQQTAGGAITLDLNAAGTANHTHQVTLTAAEVVQVRSSQQVVVTSTTTNAHTHTVTFN